MAFPDSTMQHIAAPQGHYLDHPLLDVVRFRDGRSLRTEETRLDCQQLRSRDPGSPTRRFLELSPRDWLFTRARLDVAEFERELGPLPSRGDGLGDRADGYALIGWRRHAPTLPRPSGRMEDGFVVAPTIASSRPITSPV